MFINPQSFITEKSIIVSKGSVREDGTVEVTMRGQTKRVPASRWTGENWDGQITAYGLVGKYRTGSKLWPAILRYNPGNDKTPAWEWASFGRDDRDVKFKKLNNIWFKPE